MRRYLVEFNRSNYILHHEACFTYKTCRDSCSWDRSEDLGNHLSSTQAIRKARKLYRDLCPCYCCTLEEEQERSDSQQRSAAA